MNDKEVVLDALKRLKAYSVAKNERTTLENEGKLKAQQRRRDQKKLTIKFSLREVK